MEKVSRTVNLETFESLDPHYFSNANALAKWGLGKTGFPFIDAAMTQLRQEGWIHPVAKHAVVSFLTCDQLWISWEEGLKVKLQK